MFLRKASKTVKLHFVQHCMVLNNSRGGRNSPASCGLYSKDMPVKTSWGRDAYSADHQKSNMNIRFLELMITPCRFLSAQMGVK